MKKCKLMYTFLLLIVMYIFLIFIMSLFSYFNIIKGNTLEYFKLTIIFISIFVSSLYLGFKSNSKAYIEGIKYGFLISSIIFIMSLLFKSFKLSNMVYYLIIILTSSLGSSIGINKKGKN